MNAAPDWLQHRILHRYVDGGMASVGPRQFRGIAGSSDLCSDGFALDLDGGDLSRMQGGPLNWQHGKDGPDPMIGTVLNMSADLEFLAEFLPEGADAFADQICRKLKAGAPYGLSLQFTVDEVEPLDPRNPDAGLRATRWTAMELSLCVVPVDPKGVITARSLAPIATLAPQEQAEIDRHQCMTAWKGMVARQSKPAGDYARRQADLASLTPPETAPTRRRRSRWSRPFGL